MTNTTTTLYRVSMLMAHISTLAVITMAYRQTVANKGEILTNRAIWEAITERVNTMWRQREAHKTNAEINP